MSLLSLLMLLALGQPQDYAIQSSTPEQRTEQFMAYQAQQARQLDPIQVDRIESNNTGCFAIRSYIFKREDGNAPELVGTTTCTPGNFVHQRRVGQPKARLLPAE